MAATIPAQAESKAFFEVYDALCKTDISDSGSLIEALATLLARNHVGIDAAEVRMATLAREVQASTFIGPAIALPHARLDGIDRTYVAVATSEQGVVFPLSGETAKFVALILVPKCTPAAYIKVVSSIAKKFREAGFMDALLAKNSPEELCELLNDGVRRTSGIVCAADVMRPPAAVLRETDSIKDAVDAIVRTGLGEIPVVDKDGNMIGVASARALLGRCLPDYLLWMEDLSKFVNFEPFETMMRKESSTMLKEITTNNYASVLVDRPAMAVAEKMARHKTERCFVLDGTKLAGVVTLPSFLRHIFRD